MKKIAGNVLVSIISFCLIVALLAWSLWNYRPVGNAYGTRAIFSITFLSITLALACRWLLLRMLRESGKEPSGWNALFLIDMTVPLYLAAGALINPPAAVIAALVTQGCAQAAFARRLPLSYILYRIAAIGLIIFIATIVDTLIGGPPHVRVTAQNFTSSQELINFASPLAADMIVFFLLPLSWLPILRSHSRNLSWRDFLSMRELRFQWMVLSVGLLVSIADFFDNSIGELAWLIFLLPLVTIYWLIFLSIRLSEQTNELRQSLRRQEELRQYASNITRVQENERRRLARELHDDTAQALIALARGLDGLKGQVAPKDVQWISNLQDLADQTLEGVRRACRDLRPSLLDDLGLRAALEWLSNSYLARGVACTFTCYGQETRLNPEAEIAIFRITQEALSNVWRHANANQASIELHYLPGLVQVSVRDDGQGFSVEEHSGMGLSSMRERALLIGGDLKISSAPEKGCLVDLSLALEE
ncbi:MAG TPA: sensor histidine kinase [Ktedonobacteraceae bacterium]|jgi:signal transduction histidine kinase|nr:sensor histidine kinase [Ktedonobacteraceae bacterium]